MHPRNRHQGLYDFDLLTRISPELKDFVVKRFGKDSIEFMDPKAVRALNRALLKAYYNVNFWDIPEEFLCPPIPGRADYVHTVADLLPAGAHRVLDVGTGANLIYPLIGVAEYGWSFVGTDIELRAIESAQKIIAENKLTESIDLRHQKGKGIFAGILNTGESFALSMCNPPFHASKEEAFAGTERKWRNLKRGKPGTHLNFGGQGNELWCEGGERRFVLQMIDESVNFKSQIRWFTTLVSKEVNLPSFEARLKALSPSEVRILRMSQGAKKSRALAWTFQS